MAGVALLHLIDDVHRAVLVVGLGVGHDGLFLEVAQRGQLAAAAQNGITAEEVARPCVQLAHNDAVICQRVALHNDITYAGLLALHNADFNVDRVVLHTHLHRRGFEEEVAIVHVHRSDVSARRIVAQVGLQQSAVVRVALLDAKVLQQQVRRIDCVAREVDVAEHKLVSFVDFDFHHQAFLTHLLAIFDALRGVDGVRHYASIAVTVLIIVIDDILQILVKLGLLKLGRTPETLGPHKELLIIVHIVRVLHLLQQLVGANLLVAFENQRVYLHPLSGFHIKNHVHPMVIAFAQQGVVLQAGGHLHIRVALLQIEGADTVARSGEHVLRHHVAGDNLHLLLQLVLVALLHAIDLEHGHFGTAAQFYFEENLVARNAGHVNLHILKQSLFPQAVHGSGQLVAGHPYLVSHLQASNQQYHSCVVVLGTVERYAAYLIRLGRKIVNVVFLVAHNHLGTG